MSKTVPEQIKEMQDEQFDQRMALHTMVGNLTNWRTNRKNHQTSMKMIQGRMRILNLLDRFKV